MHYIKMFFCVVKEIKDLIPKKFKQQLPGIFAFMIIAALLDTIGIAVILPFVKALVNIDLLINNKYIQQIMSIFNIETAYGVIAFIGFAIIFVYIIKNMALLLLRTCIYKYNVSVQQAFAIEMLNDFMKRPYEFFLQNNPSELATRLNTDVAGIYNILDCLLALLADGITVIAICILLITTDFLLTVGMFLLVIILIIAIVFGFKKFSIKTGNEYREASIKLNVCALQALNGIKDIYVMQRRKHFSNVYEDEYNKYSRAYVKNIVITLSPSKITETVLISGLILFTVFEMFLGAEMTDFIPKISTFAVGAYRLLPAVNKISENFNRLIVNIPYLASAYKNYTETRQWEANQEKYIGVNKQDNNEVAMIFDNTLEIRNVSFHYVDSDKNVIDNLNMKINKGQSIGLIGESGAGKSTLGDIVLGLLHPQKGAVYLDGKDVFTMPMQWASVIGYVPQSVYLIDDTIRANIAFGIPKEKIDEQKVLKAVDRAQLSKFIFELPNGLDTVVGDKGVRLSGGQRQRIAIARALYNNPEILVLDEATSALDNDTEEAVMEAINVMQGEKTLIIIAHRLGTIADCDKIFEIKDGQAIEKTKAEVMNS